MSNKPKFTPGPWSISGVGPKGSKRLIYAPNCTTVYPVATVELDHLDRFGSGDTDATAALIAAAPDMYRAFEQLLEAHYSGEPYAGPSIDQIEKILAKARGES